jgi:hypothetical protein
MTIRAIHTERVTEFPMMESGPCTIVFGARTFKLTAGLGGNGPSPSALARF